MAFEEKLLGNEDHRATALLALLHIEALLLQRNKVQLEEHQVHPNALKVKITTEQRNGFEKVPRTPTALNHGSLGLALRQTILDCR